MKKDFNSKAIVLTKENGVVKEIQKIKKKIDPMINNKIDPKTTKEKILVPKYHKKEKF